MKLLDILIKEGYAFQLYSEYENASEQKVILLRHDVDARPDHSLTFARLQHKMGIVGTYYFRMVPQSFDEGVIREIASMGHEIGYHYETMDAAGGDQKKAIERFKKNLEKLRTLADVETICMHGSPMSKYDNRDLWQHYDYRDYGIIAEPYFDLDFSKVLYLTDTGRRWDGQEVSIRDKVPGSGHKIQGSKGRAQDASSQDSPNSRVFEKRAARLATHDYHSTHDIINACKAGNLPDQIMFNFHPQRWTDNPLLWTQELIWQNIKNMVKRGVVKVSS